MYNIIAIIYGILYSIIQYNSYGRPKLNNNNTNTPENINRRKHQENGI